MESFPLQLPRLCADADEDASTMSPVSRDSYSSGDCGGGPDGAAGVVPEKVSVYVARLPSQRGGRPLDANEGSRLLLRRRALRVAGSREHLEHITIDLTRLPFENWQGYVVFKVGTDGSLIGKPTSCRCGAFAACWQGYLRMVDFVFS